MLSSNFDCIENDEFRVVPVHQDSQDMLTPEIVSPTSWTPYSLVTSPGCTGTTRSLSFSLQWKSDERTKHCMLFLNKDGFYSVRLLTSRQTPKLEDRSRSAVHDCLFNIFAANLHIWRPTSPSATRGDAPCRGDRNPRMNQFINTIN